MPRQREKLVVTSVAVSCGMTISWITIREKQAWLIPLAGTATHDSSVYNDFRLLIY